MAIVKITLGLGLGGALGALLGYLGSCTSGACPLTATPWRGTFFGALTGLVMACALGQGCGTASRTVPKRDPPPEASSRNPT